MGGREAEGRVGEWESSSGQRQWAVREQTAKELRNMKGIKAKALGPFLSPSTVLLLQNSLCSLAPKPRRNLQVLAGVNGAFLIVFSSATVDQVAKFGSGVVLGNL